MVWGVLKENWFLENILLKINKNLIFYNVKDNAFWMRLIDTLSIADEWYPLFDLLSGESVCVC